MMRIQMQQVDLNTGESIPFTVDFDETQDIPGGVNEFIPNLLAALAASPVVEGGDKIVHIPTEEEDEAIAKPAPPPDGIEHRAPVDVDGCPIIGQLPPTWDSNAETWGAVEWLDIDIVFRHYVAMSCPEEDWDAPNAESFIRYITANHCMPPYFEGEIPDGIDWQIVAREFNTTVCNNQ